MSLADNINKKGSDIFMKLYKFYNKVIDELGGDRYNSIDEKYPLIGHTNKKKIRDMYVASRNPKSFIEIVTDISKEDYLSYANSYNGQKLDIYEYLSPKYTSTREVDLSHISIVTSWFERESISSIEDEGMSYIMENSVRYNVIFPFVFKSKYIKALNDLEFIAFWKLLANPNAYKNIMTDEEYESCDNYYAPSIIWNEFRSLIDEFSDYFLSD